jgi:O-antigen/teichoic acid export membrane protein
VEIAQRPSESGCDKPGLAVSAQPPGETAVEPVPSVATGIRPGAGSESVVRRILEKASATLFLQGGSLLMGFASTVLLARFLGGADYGRYVFAFAWASLLTIPAILGFDRFLVRGIAVYEVNQDWALMRGLLRRTNQFVLLISTAIVAIGCGTAALLLSPSLRAPFCVAMLIVPITALTLLRQGAMQAIGRIVSGQLPEYLIRPVLILVGICALKFAGGGLLTATTALTANVVGLAIAFTVGAILLMRALPAEVRSVQPRYASREWLRASLPMMLISGIWMANNYCTTLVVGTLAGDRAVGVYSVVQKGAELIVLVLLAANMALAPTLARLYAQNDRKGLEHATERIAQATLLVSGPLAVGFIVFAGVYLSIFGPSFHTATTALTILAFGQLVNAAAGPAGNVLLMTGHERAAMRGIGLGLAANLILAVILVPVLGVTGGAIAFAVSLVLWNTALVLIARRRVGINVTAFRWLAIHQPLSMDSGSEVDG